MNEVFHCFFKEKSLDALFRERIQGGGVPNNESLKLTLDLRYILCNKSLSGSLVYVWFKHVLFYDELISPGFLGKTSVTKFMDLHSTTVVSIENLASEVISLFFILSIQL